MDLRRTTQIFSLGIDFSFVKMKGFSNSQCARFLGSIFTTLDEVVVGGAQASRDMLTDIQYGNLPQEWLLVFHGDL